MNITITGNDSLTTLLLLALEPSPIHGAQPLRRRHFHSPLRTWGSVFLSVTGHRGSVKIFNTNEKHKGCIL